MSLINTETNIDLRMRVCLVNLGILGIGGGGGREEEIKISTVDTITKGRGKIYYRSSTVTFIANI